MANPWFQPGSLRSKLQEKIKQADVQKEPEKFEIKNTDPESFAKIPSWYHAPTSQQPVTTKQSVFPTNSPITKSPHERMKSFVKQQFEKK